MAAINPKQIVCLQTRSSVVQWQLELILTNDHPNKIPSMIEDCWDAKQFKQYNIAKICYF